MEQPCQLPEPLEVWVAALSDDELTHLGAHVADEQRSRAANRGDIEAIIEQAFGVGFDSRGHAKTPWVDGSLLICPGSIVERSASSHDCTFVNIDDHWVWDYGDVVRDDVRKKPERGREHQRSITVLPAIEGIEFDLVSSKMRTGAHQMAASRSFRIVNGALELVSARTIKASGHR
jgi:hypothetical protein